MKYQKIFDTFVCIFLRFILQEIIFTKKQDFRKGEIVLEESLIQVKMIYEKKI